MKRFRIVLLFLGISLSAGTAMAAPGDVLFSDNLNGNLNSWTVTSSGGDADINNLTRQSGRSLSLRWGPVTVTSDPFDASVPGVRLDAWIRRGSDEFSEDPDNNEDLVVEYFDDNGNWNTVTVYVGDQTAGQIFNLSVILPSDALHSSLRIRFQLTDGGGSDLDYWHIDDVSVTEIAPSGSFGLGACTDFESGLEGWSVSASGGDAGVSGATSSSGGFSLFTRWGQVTVSSPTVSLAGTSDVELSVWVRRGADSFSEDPDGSENLQVEYLDDAGNWVVLETFSGDGSQGEIFDRVYPLTGGALHAGFRVRIRQLRGDGEDFDYWHVDDVCLTGTQRVSFVFEEAEWTGASGEAVDSGPGALTGTAFGGASTAQSSPAIAGNPGTCRYGDFDGVDDYIEIPDDPALDFPTAVTVGVWINARSIPGSDLHSIVSKDWNYEFHINSASQVFWFWNNSSGTTRTLTSTATITTDRWYHVAIAYEPGNQVIYLDGVPVASSSFNEDLRLNDNPLFIGTDLNFLSRAWDGFIDEVNIFGRALTQAEIQTLMMETRPCATVAPQFEINHDGFGINCLGETVSVTVIDAAAGTPLLDYNATIVLDTQSGSGTWQLVSGGGSLVDATSNDGVATYAWPLTESQAVFSLFYPEGVSPIDVDVFQQSNIGIRDTDTEGVLAFSPNGFTVTAAPLTDPPPASIQSFNASQVAGTDFAMYLTAFGQTPSDPVCGVIESYTGTRVLDFWVDRQNPAGGSIVPTINGVAIADSELVAGDSAVAFVNGRAVVAAKYKDAGQIRISVKDETPIDPELAGGIRGGSAGFVVRPFEFRLSAIGDAAGNSNPAAAGAGGPVFLAAGAPFQATVTAFDAEGSVTPNFGQETIPEGVALNVGLVAPAGGAAPSLLSSDAFGSFSGGSATGTAFAWPEVGIITLTPSVADGDYLGAGNVGGPASANVGRFTPHHFEAVVNEPVFDTACSAGSFTYLGEPFDYAVEPEITVAAKALSGDTTANYRGSFFKLSNLPDPVYSSATESLDLSGLVNNGAASVFSNGDGTARVSFAAGNGLAFLKGEERASFDADILLSQDVIDLDGVTATANPVVFGNPNGILFDDGAEMRYGRIALLNAFGSELVDLPLTLRSEYYFNDTTGFVPNTDDECPVSIELSVDRFTDNLSSTDTCLLDAGPLGLGSLICPLIPSLVLTLTDPPIAGQFSAGFKAPGDGNDGGLRITADVPEYLEYDWDATVPGTEDPEANATFGIFKGFRKRIFIREVY